MRGCFKLQKMCHFHAELGASWADFCLRARVCMRACVRVRVRVRARISIGGFLQQLLIVHFVHCETSGNFFVKC